jgi:tetratricopeptide (TPR) repeat protein
MRLRELRVINAVNLGVNVLRMLDYDRALDIFKSAQTMASTEAMDDIASECEVRIAEVYALRGDAAQALKLLIPAQTALEKCSHHWGLATLFLLRAKCQADLDNLTDAMESNALAREAAGRANAKHIALRIEREAAVAAEKLGDLGQALQCMKRAAVLQTELDHGTKSQMLRELRDLASTRTITNRERPPSQPESIGRLASAHRRKPVA